MISLNLGPQPQSGGVCTTQGVIMHFFQMAGFAWVFLIAFNMLLLVVFEKRDTKLFKWEIGYHIFG